jgi:hypothetical protein
MNAPSGEKLSFKKQLQQNAHNIAALSQYTNLLRIDNEKFRSRQRHKRDNVINNIQHYILLPYNWTEGK